MPRTGRPPLFRARVALTTYVDAAEYRRLKRSADRAGISLSQWARARLLEAAGANVPAASRRRRAMP
jgi:hypothetical protein